MTETSFTPGRWFAMGCDVKPLGDKPYICWTGTPEREKDEARANANLIAAAPELYEALVMARDHVEENVEICEEAMRYYETKNKSAYELECYENSKLNYKNHIEQLNKIDTVLRKARGEGGF